MSSLNVTWTGWRMGASERFNLRIAPFSFLFLVQIGEKSSFEVCLFINVVFLIFKSVGADSKTMRPEYLEKPVYHLTE